MDERTKPDDSGRQIKGQVNKLPMESDPIGINCEGGVTTNEDGDPPASELELMERHLSPVQLENVLMGSDSASRYADSNPSNKLSQSRAARDANRTVGDSVGLADQSGNPESDSLSDQNEVQRGGEQQPEKTSSGGTAPKGGPDGSTKSTGSDAGGKTK